MEFVETNPLCIVDESCNFEGVEIIVDSGSSTTNTESQDGFGSQGYGEDVIYLSSSTSEEGNSCDNLEPSGSTNQVYLPTAVFLRPVNSSASFEDVVQVIQIDPDRPDESSLQESVYPNNWFENLETYRLQLYNAPDTNCIPDKPEYINIANVLPKEDTVVPFLNLNRNCNTVTGPTNMDIDEDDDVMFVCEYNAKPSHAVKTEEKTAVHSSSPAATSRRRKRRKTFGEKRKNPVRKAQIEKASADLIEKLSIPPSVFNARIKRKTLKQQSPVEQKSLRQSCRTTGAILRPPSPLSKTDFKEWPAEGMHERPVYNEETGTIRKYDFEPLEKKHKYAGKRSALTAITNKVNLAQAPSEKSIGRKMSAKEKQNIEKFEKLTHDRFHMMLGYTEEVKEFNKIIAKKEVKDEPKETVYDRSIEFRKSRMVSSANAEENRKISKKFSKMVENDKKKNMQNATDMLADTCVLYGLANGVSGKAIANYITSLTVAEGKNWLKKQL